MRLNLGDPVDLTSTLASVCRYTIDVSVWGDAWILCYKLYANLFVSLIASFNALLVDSDDV